MTDPIARIKRLPIWSEDVAPEPLAGGLSNRSYTVASGGRRLVVRLGEDLVHHHVLRHHELMASRAAHGLGLSPEVVYAEPGLMVLAHIEGRALTAADVRADLSRIVDLIRRYHVEMAREVSGPAALFSPFHVVRDYARQLQRAGSPWCRMLDRLLGEAHRLERMQVSLPLVFGHNDLLPANLIEGHGRLWLIDHEYAAFASPLFDLAGLAANANLSQDASARLLTLYFGAPPSSEVIESHRTMQCVSLLREAMWGMVSELHPGQPGIDYTAYARDNLERFDAALTGLGSRG